NYKDVENQLHGMSQVKGVVTAFNVNIDAVIRITGAEIEALLKKVSSLQLEKSSIIKAPEDVLSGLLHCFSNGIAEEWLIEEKQTFDWISENIGFDKLQMGGQGGIVANAMAVCGVEKVFAHCASLPKQQAELFLDLPNLFSVNQKGETQKAVDISRAEDAPLIHWIIEFDKGDEVKFGDKILKCPKSNRFIATYDPHNFKLHIDKAFSTRMTKEKFDYVILSGYHMLQEKIFDGSSGIEKIDASREIIKSWKKSNPDAIFHLEVASTQDKAVRKHIIDTICKNVDSMGLNERETMDLLEVIGENELLEACEKDTSAVNLFKGLMKIKDYTGCPRIQLHMFGLYLTVQDSVFKISPKENRNGMQLASVIAATKAGTGAINSSDVLLWAKDKPVSDISLKELKNLTSFVESEYGKGSLETEGIFSTGDTEIIAVPTILIEKPIALVGMGDTISSISLVAAR
ncbi:MAG: ADP-dependent glucokinase/phosphofructokinase, partial [Alphaproteobacteria bacterium]|nr:ADP-dependent glucokinase/phosphofructokinase [Alphaproteobacteria bacterium]